MSEYTPTTEEVRNSYVSNTLLIKNTPLEIIGSEAPLFQNEFDSWLAEHERKVSERVWEEGHKTAWKRGPSGCRCYAYSSSECACGKYGTGALLSLNDNPYRKEDN